MRHAKKRLQLNRFTSWRRATLKSMARNLLIYQSMTTTKQKAYAVRPLIEKLIGLGKKNTLAAKRQAYKILGDHKLVSLLFGEIAPRFIGRIGGYTRIMRLGSRRGDGADVVVLELTEIKKKEVKKPKKQEEELQPKAEEAKPETKEKPIEEKKPVVEKPPLIKKPVKKFLGGLRGIFKKERDSL